MLVVIIIANPTDLQLTRVVAIMLTGVPSGPQT